jgi:MFS family permease
MDRSRAWRTYLSVPFNVWMIGFVTFLKNTSSVVLVIFCPIYLSDVLCIQMGHLGALEGLLEATSFFSRIASGILSDVLRRRKPALILGYFFSLLGRVFLTFSTTGTGIIASRACERLGNGIQGSPRDALVGDFTTPQNRGACFGLRNSLTVAGSIVGSLLAMWFMKWSHNDYQTLFSLTLIPSIAAIILLIICVKDSKLTAREERKERPSLRDIFKNMGHLPRTFWVLNGINFLVMMSNFGMLFLVMTAKQLGLPSELTPLVMILQSCATVLSAFPLGKLADVVPKKRMLQTGIVIFVFSNFGMALTPNIWGVYICVLLWGVQMAAVQNTTLAIATNVTPQNIRGTGFGTLQLTSGIATLLANALGGLLWDQFSYKMTFLAGGILAAGALIVTFTLKRDA